MDENNKVPSTEVDLISEKISLDIISVSSGSLVNERVSIANALIDRDRWTHPLTGSAASAVAVKGKQLSYVQQMAQRFEKLAEASNDMHECNWWLKKAAVRADSNDLDGLEDEEDALRCCTVNFRRESIQLMGRSKSLDELGAGGKSRLSGEDSGFYKDEEEGNANEEDNTGHGLINGLVENMTISDSDSRNNRQRYSTNSSCCCEAILLMRRLHNNNSV